MKFKSLLIAIGMAVGLFAYGYTLSTAGHDHSAHQGSEQHDKGAVDSHEDGHDDHSHNDSHH